jgi:hypothetical protein
VTSDLAAKTQSAEHSQGGGSTVHSAGTGAKCFVANILPLNHWKQRPNPLIAHLQSRKPACLLAIRKLGGGGYPLKQLSNPENLRSHAPAKPSAANIFQADFHRPE